MPLLARVNLPGPAHADETTRPTSHSDQLFTSHSTQGLFCVWNHALWCNSYQSKGRPEVIVLPVTRLPSRKVLVLACKPNLIDLSGLCRTFTLCRLFVSLHVRLLPSTIRPNKHLLLRKLLSLSSLTLYLNSHHKDSVHAAAAAARTTVVSIPLQQLPFSVSPPCACGPHHFLLPFASNLTNLCMLQDACQWHHGSTIWPRHVWTWLCTRQLSAT